MPAPVSPVSQPSQQLVPIAVDAPGSYGLNLQAQNSVLDPKWAIQAENAVIDAYGRVAARGGRTTVTSSAAAGQVRAIFEYITATGGSMSIVGFDGGISSSITAPSGSSLVGTVVSVGSGRWFFQNFNNKCVGFQAGQKPIVLQSPVGTFSNIVEASGAAPQGGIGCAAYGRLWGIAADGQTLQWCALLDETNWAAGDAGSINLAKAWPNGMDVVTAIFPFSNSLVVCGQRQIIIYGSTDPTTLGLDVTQITVLDAIIGVGCLNQWTVAHIGGEKQRSDVLFCTAAGVQSIQRLVLNSGSRPIQNLTKKVRDALITMLRAETTNNVSGFYSKTNGFYALSLPTSGYTWILDQRHKFQDEDGDEVARVTRFPFGSTACVEFNGRNVYFASSTVGKIQQYLPGTDDGANFVTTLQLPWMDLGQDYAARLKSLKRVGALIYAQALTNLTFTWYSDFSLNGASNTQTVAGGTPAYWGVSQWGIDQWGGGGLLTLLYANASGQGQYFSLQIAASSDSNFAIQQSSLLAKLLRLA